MPADERDPQSDAPPAPARLPWEPGPVAVPEPASSPDAVFCRRCGETSVPVENCCPWCRAWLVGDPPSVAPVYEDNGPEDDWHAELEERDFRPPPPKPSQAVPLAVVGVSYFLLLGSLVLFMFFAVVYQITGQEEMFKGLAVVEALDALLTVGALALVWKSARQVRAERTGLLAWLVAWPMLAALLAVNILFITYLRELFKPFGPVETEKIGVTWVTVLLICVQPAIVEELFFRQMVLGVLRKSLNVHLAVWLTAAMFAFAHLGNPIGMPYLFLAGAVFGYARVFGGLPLPMVMHFVHNFVVIAYAAWH
jgi:membrane protease YdiL (CAAX protease family)